MWGWLSSCLFWTSAEVDFTIKSLCGRGYLSGKGFVFMRLLSFLWVITCLYLFYKKYKNLAECIGNSIRYLERCEMKIFFWGRGREFKGEKCIDALCFGEKSEKHFFSTFAALQWLFIIPPLVCLFFFFFYIFIKQ